MGKDDFITDVKTLRERARKHIENGAVTEGYKADRDTVIRLLQEALATEIVCVLRYKRHYFMAQGIHAQAVAAEFLQHANEEQGHADQISARIVQLGGAPNLNPEGLLTRSHSEYVEGGKPGGHAEGEPGGGADRHRLLRGDGPLRRRRRPHHAPDAGGILAVEEEHADDLATLLATLDPTKKG